MLKDNLLLDSARPFSVKASNIYQGGCPERSSLGVPLSCLPASPEFFQRSMDKWYALRVSYSRELKVQAMFQENGVRTFVPMMWKKKETSGKTQKVLVPAVNNLCFVYWNRNAIEEIIDLYGETSPVHFYWDRAQNRPMEVPEKAMEDFIKVASRIDQDILYFNEVSDKFRAGQKVTVLEGAFAGVVGKVIRVKKSRRVLVELPGLFAVATAYINPSCLEVVSAE